MTEELITITKEKYEYIQNYLDERSRRIWAAIEAKYLGWGGQTVINKATGIDYNTIRKGIEELGVQKEFNSARMRRNGGGRKKLINIQPEILEIIEGIIDSTTGGDPESPLRWTCKSSYNIAEELKKQGYPISQKTVYTILSKELEYSLQANKKTEDERSQHPDRNSQFEYINNKIKLFQKKNCPTLSVDTKKKENIGNYKNNGREYSEKGKPLEVNMHDFIDKRLGKVVPYGVFDIGRNKGWVSVGVSSDTAEFAVNAIRAWWYNMGIASYNKAKKILITSDSGGSNGYRVRLWKFELQKLVNEISKEIHVCHFPPGTSKWNKIEHRMFSYISKNWRGRPLITKETVVNLIGNTITEGGLKIMAMLDENSYKTGINVTDEEFSKLNIVSEKFHGEWNYKIKPQNL